MAKKVTPAYEMAEARSKASGRKSASTLASLGLNEVRSLELNNIEEGETVSFADSIVFHEVTFGTQKTAMVNTLEGKQFYIGCLTRGATPLDGSPRVKPSGTVVEECQKYSELDKFFTEKLAGNSITFTKKTPVIARGYNGEETRTVNVWQIDFAK